MKFFTYLIAATMFMLVGTGVMGAAVVPYDARAPNPGTIIQDVLGLVQDILKLVQDVVKLVTDLSAGPIQPADGPAALDGVNAFAVDLQGVLTSVSVITTAANETYPGVVNSGSLVSALQSLKSSVDTLPSVVNTVLPDYQAETEALFNQLDTAIQSTISGYGAA